MLANLAKMLNLAILAKFSQGRWQNISSEYISATRRALKMLANLVTMANLAILVRFGQLCG